MWNILESPKHGLNVWSIYYGIIDGQNYKLSIGITIETIQYPLSSDVRILPSCLRVCCGHIQKKNATSRKENTPPDTIMQMTISQ